MCEKWLKKKNRKTHAKKRNHILFPVKDMKIPDIFYQILKFLGTSLASVIAHKHLLL